MFEGRGGVVDVHVTTCAHNCGHVFLCVCVCAVREGFLVHWSQNKKKPVDS